MPRWCPGPPRLPTLSFLHISSSRRLSFSPLHTHIFCASFVRNRFLSFLRHSLVLMQRWLRVDVLPDGCFSTCAAPDPTVGAAGGQGATGRWSDQPAAWEKNAGNPPLVVLGAQGTHPPFLLTAFHLRFVLEGCIHFTPSATFPGPGCLYAHTPLAVVPGFSRCQLCTPLRSLSFPPCWHPSLITPTCRATRPASLSLSLLSQPIDAPRCLADHCHRTHAAPPAARPAPVSAAGSADAAAGSAAAASTSPPPPGAAAAAAAAHLPAAQRARARQPVCPYKQRRRGRRRE